MLSTTTKKLSPSSTNFGFVWALTTVLATMPPSFFASAVPQTTNLRGSEVHNPPTQTFFQDDPSRLLQGGTVSYVCWVFGNQEACERDCANDPSTCKAICRKWSSKSFAFCATPSPTDAPTSSPTQSPSESPTANPTGYPSQTPTASPTQSPSLTPTTSPTQNPTYSPTSGPSASPTSTPSLSPTSSPTQMPTSSPTNAPTAGPSASPSSLPTAQPTDSPTSSPTKGCGEVQISHSCEGCNNSPSVTQCTERPSGMMLLFQGGSCERSHNSQIGTVQCTDFFEAIPLTAHIRVESMKNAETIYFDNVVEQGDYIALDANGGRFDANLRVVISTKDRSSVLQEISDMNVLCSGIDLYLQDIFGAMQVIEYYSDEQGKITCLQDLDFAFSVSAPELAEQSIIDLYSASFVFSASNSQVLESQDYSYPAQINSASDAEYSASVPMVNFCTYGTHYTAQFEVTSLKDGSLECQEEDQLELSPCDNGTCVGS